MFTLLDYTLYEALPYGLMVIGLVLTFRYLRLIDLTFAASFAIGPAVLARLMLNGHGFWLSLAVAVGATLCVAALTAYLLLVLRLDALLAGIVSSFGGYALALLFTRGSLSLSTIDTPLSRLQQLDLPWTMGRAPLHPWQVGCFACVVLATKVVLDAFLRSELGLSYRALEDDRSASTLLPSLGVSPGLMTAGGLVVGNLLSMSSGILVALKENQATAQRGFDALLSVIAAYLLGLGVFERRARTAEKRFSTWLFTPARWLQRFGASTAAVLGLVTYFGLLQAVSRFDVPASVPKLIIVGLLVLVLSTSRWTELRARLMNKNGGVTFGTPAEASLRVEGSSITYAGFPEPIEVVRGAKLEVAPGELVQITGPNGSGKSTLLRFVAGELSGTGRIYVPGLESVGDARGRRTAISLIRQDATSATCATLSPREHLTLYATASHASPVRSWRKWWNKREELPAYLAHLLATNDPVACLSGGQRQVLSVASLLVRRNAPYVILFDEPLTYLDADNAGYCVDLIEELLIRRKRILLVQHDLPLRGGVEDVSDDVDSARRRLATLVTRRVSMRDVQSSEENARGDPS